MHITGANVQHCWDIAQTQDSREMFISSRRENLQRGTLIVVAQSTDKPQNWPEICLMFLVCSLKRKTTQAKKNT